MKRWLKRLGLLSEEPAPAPAPELPQPRRPDLLHPAMPGPLRPCTVGVRVPVSDVSPAEGLLPELRWPDAVGRFLRKPVEAWPTGAAPLVAAVDAHPLIEALHHAFTGHRPLVLSPDVIWLTLAQGVAHHINLNAEELRARLVSHGGREVLQVRRDDFVKGSPENDWPAVFSALSDHIRAHNSDMVDLVTADFSTTDPVARVASQVVLMDAMQAYFDYMVISLCGIPSVHLTGTPDDWRRIRARVERFAPLGLERWLTHLRPVLDQFVAAAEGQAAPRFWRDIYKWQGPKGSGSPWISGWVIDLFPYINNLRTSFEPDAPRLLPNPHLGQRGDGGPDRASFPNLPAEAPFVWAHLGGRSEMVFVGGLVGVRQDHETLALQPEIGWAVRDQSAPPLPTEDPWHDDAVDILSL